MQGNLHVPFLGGLAGAIPPGYPAMRKQTMRNLKHCALSLPNDADGGLVCVTVYRKGAQEVVNRLAAHPHAHWCRYCRTPAVCTTATCTPTTEWICPACARWFATPH